jgi:uncharacterized protein YbjT (DUF2867 family)
VVGSTGSQGGSTIPHLLQLGAKVRALTRDPTKPAAEALAKLDGVEVVQADPFDAASMESAFAGCHGVFQVTFFWSHMDMHKEKQEVEIATAAAKKAGVTHYIYSTLPGLNEGAFAKTVPAIHGTAVPHFDMKAACDKLVEGQFPIASLVMAGCYWDNFMNFGIMNRTEGKLTIVTSLPEGGMIPGLCLDDFGQVVAQMFNAGDASNGKKVFVVSESLTPATLAAQASEILGEEVNNSLVPSEIYRTFPFPGADDLGNMWCAFGHKEFTDIVETYSGKPGETPIWETTYGVKATPFKVWCAAHQDALKKIGAA